MQWTLCRPLRMQWTLCRPLRMQWTLCRPLRDEHDVDAQDGDRHVVDAHDAAATHASAAFKVVTLSAASLDWALLRAWLARAMGPLITH